MIKKSLDDFSVVYFGFPPLFCEVISTYHSPITLCEFLTFSRKTNCVYACILHIIVTIYKTAFIS